MLEEQTFDALLEEYKSLRTESLNSILHRNQIMGLSFTAMSFLISAASIAKIPNIIAAATLLLLVPTVSKLVSLIWLGEYERSKRAGAAIEVIELNINRFLTRNALTWENDLSKKGISMVYPYVATFGIMLGSGYMSILVASVFLQNYLEGDIHLAKARLICVVVILIAFAIEITFLVQLRKMWRSIRTRYVGMFSSDQVE